MKPINGTFPSNLWRIIEMASPTYFSRPIAPSTVSLFRSSGVTSGSGKNGPGFISTTMPSACGITRISEKIIEASRSKRRIGCIVTSHASSGVRQIVKKSCCFRTSCNQNECYSFSCLVEMTTLNIQSEYSTPEILANNDLLAALPILEYDLHLRLLPLVINCHFLKVENSIQIKSMKLKSLELKIFFFIKIIVTSAV